MWLQQTQARLERGEGGSEKEQIAERESGHSAKNDPGDLGRRGKGNGVEPVVISPLFPLSHI